MMKINQKNMVPRYGDSHRFILSRSAFLATHAPPRRTCYFGPGQPPDSGADSGLVEDAYDVTSDSSEFPGTDQIVHHPYRPPADWPKANTLLRVPQVAWLSAWMPNGADIRTDMTNVTVNVSGLVTLPPRSIDDENLEYRQGRYVASYTVPDLYNVEYRRLLAIYADAKAILAAIRPNRTWVDAIDWGGPTGGDWKWFGANRYLPLLAPRDVSAGAFGTNFLHLYAGTAACDTVVSSVNRVGQVTLTPTALESDSTYLTSVARLETAFPLFAGYAARLYGVSFPWTAQTATYRSILIWHNVVGGSGGAQFTGSESYYPGALAAARAAATAALPPPGLAQMVTRDGASNAVLGRAATDLADQGVSYGGLSSDLTAEAIVAMIADHFRFDPGTGKDL